MQQEYIGPSSISALKQIISQAQAKRVLLFSGKASFEKYKDSILQNIPCAYAVYNDFQVNPKLDEVLQCVAEHTPHSYDMLIAVGGGSVLDFAKLYKYYALKALTDEALAEGPFSGKAEDGALTAPALPLVAIPTTAGTGSEVTQFAIVYIEGEKHTVDATSLYPQYAIVDSTLLSGSPRYVKACTAMDAYCQAMESYWAVASTKESRAHAKEAIQLAHRHIVPFVNSEDAQAAEGMALASNLAGKAIQISKTTAAHALCYKLTTGYGLPHGHAVALSMIDLFAANTRVDEATCQDPRGVAHVQACMQDILRMVDTQDFTTYWMDLAQALGLEMRFSVLQVTNKEELFAAVNVQRLQNNPKNIMDDLQNFWIS